MEEKCIVNEKGNIFNEPDSNVTYAPANNYDIRGKEVYLNERSNKKANHVKKAKELLEKDKYDNSNILNVYSDGVKLKGAVCEITDHSNNLSEKGLSEKKQPGSETKKKFLYTVDFSEYDSFSNKSDTTYNWDTISDINEPKPAMINMKKAYLAKATLNFANLENANLAEANLQEAILNKANLKNAFLTKTILQKSNLSFASFENALLWETNLQEAYLEGAYFENAYILEANLDGAQMLSLEQLSKAKTLHKTRLKPELMEQVIRYYPQLLEVPKMNDLANWLIKY
ncbi:MAG: pentapeptide repeat-containing protein [Candidatus Scalindua sp.]